MYAKINPHLNNWNSFAGPFLYKGGYFRTCCGFMKESHVRSPCQPSKNVFDIGVVAPGLGDSDTKLRVAQGPDGRDDACDDPDHQRHAHRAGVLQDTLRTDEDT